MVMDDEPENNAHWTRFAHGRHPGRGRLQKTPHVDRAVRLQRFTGVPL
jgi:hypothetical protein